MSKQKINRFVGSIGESRMRNQICLTFFEKGKQPLSYQK